MSFLTAEATLAGTLVLHCFAKLNLSNVLILRIHLLGLPLILAIRLLELNVFRKVGD